MKKYKLTEESKVLEREITVYRIEALKDFTLINGKEVKKGDKGGWLQSEANMSQEGNCWVYEECVMMGNSHRSGDSIGYGNSLQYGNSRQYGNSMQYDNSRQGSYSRQYGNSRQYGDSWQYGNSMQYGNSRQYDNSWQYGNSRQFGNSRQYGNSQQYENSQQYGNSQQHDDSQQYDNSMQFGISQQYNNSRQGGNIIHATSDDIVTLISPTSGRTITIGKDRTIHTGCFSGTSWWLIDPMRKKLPKDHWAFKLHEQLLQGKFHDIEL